MHRFALRLGLVTVPFVAAAAPAPPVSAPISNISYDITFTRETAARRSIGVAMQFDVSGSGDVLLSLPSWSPGAYEVTNFARWVSEFAPTAGGQPLHWDKLDYDTWRIRPAGARHVTVAFTYRADSLDNAIAWSRPDFAFVNGTNIFLYPEGRSLAFPATVQVHTESDWMVATGMHPVAGGGWSEPDYHDLADMPFFIGHFDFDSMPAGPVNARLASYPAGMLAGEARQKFWDAYRPLFAAEGQVFGEIPFTSYTTLIVFDSAYGGGSALEHQNSHLAIYTVHGIGQTWVTSVTAHEMFHAWNVKRMRPAEMVPYRYDTAEPTPWLWVSEGITDYYADLALTRSGDVDSTAFLNTTMGKIRTVDGAPPVALEDASLSTWIHPVDGTGYLYYPKGSLAGFMLDIMIRDASDNHRSLDDVMREVYRTTWKAGGKGFTGRDWWGAVRRAAGGRDFTAFNDRYVDGREPYPWDSLLPLAGMRLRVDSATVPRLGVQTTDDSAGSHVVAVAPDGAAAAAGVQVGDVILALGDVTVKSFANYEDFRARYAGSDGADLPIRVRRDGQELTLPGKVQLLLVTQQRLDLDPNATPKAVRIRHGILTGTED
ncbi:MAG TPA: PDZ domain-containing protein [Gemmatimonadales bacterium]|nr:PDZ domain-containing protein [Gemmatimonadales bacterium]